MSAAASFRTVLVGKLSGPEAQRKVARIAREFRDGLIASGRASGAFNTTVNGVDGAAEETVRPAGGVILYRFNGMAAAVDFALDYVRARSPMLTGRYRNSWMVWVDGRPFASAPAKIPAGAEVFIVNMQPYSRKIDMGANTASQLAFLNSGRIKGRAQGKRALRMISIVEGARQAAMPRFPGLRVERDMLTLPAPYNYTLKSTGERMTFPALVMNLGEGWSLQSSSARTLRQVNGQGVRRKRSGV